MERRVAELHLIRARESALRLFSLASTIFPEEWAKQFDEIAVVDLTEFAIHARRLTELCTLRDDKFDGTASTRYLFTVPPPEPLESDYHEALNALIHAKTYKIGHAIWDGPKVYTSSAQNISISYVQIATDRRPQSCVSVFGVTWCFLSNVLPVIRTRNPEFQF